MQMNLEQLGAEESVQRPPEHQLAVRQLAVRLGIRPSPSPSVPPVLGRRRRCPFEKGRRLAGQ
jgi:hypothetical protein